MQKDKKLNITREKLVQAVTELMSDCTDGSDVTSRAIAERAGV